MIEICKNCGNKIYLTGENIGRQIGYYGTCGNCKASYYKDVDARDSSRVLREGYHNDSVEAEKKPKPQE